MFGQQYLPPLAPVDAENMLALCQDLIRLPSYTGSEGQVARKLEQTMLQLGFDRVWLDQAGNVMGEIRGVYAGPKVLFDGHIDTVEVSDQDKWTVNPFGGDVINGRIYGRGASDMKCAVAAMVHGLAPLVRFKDKLRGSVYVSGTVCEETFEGLGLSKVIGQIQPDFVIIGEASNLDIKRGQRGRAEISLTAYGKAAHSSNPAVGKNAVYLMTELINQIRMLPVPNDSFLGEGISELTDIISAPYPGASVVPHRCRATFDRRLLTGETEESVLAPIRSAISALRQADPDCRAEADIVAASQECYTGLTLSGKRFFPAWVLPESSPLVQAALTGLRQAGLTPNITKYSFCTNGSYSAGIAGIPTIGFGPGREDGAHIVDEYLDLEQLAAAAVGYQAIAASLTCEQLEEESE